MGFRTFLAAGLVCVLLTTTTCLSAIRDPVLYRFTTQRFRIVGDNVNRVVGIQNESQDVILSLHVGACYYPSGHANLLIRVRGASAGTFHLGKFVATGAWPLRGELIPAVRPVTRMELGRLGCVIH